MVCCKISGKDGIPNLASMTGHTPGSHGRSPELRELISIPSESVEEKQEEGR